MTGTTKNPGLMVLTLKDLFLRAESQSNSTNEYCISMSYLEVYNEHIRDLLNFQSGDTFLDLREDPIKGIVVSGITEIFASSAVHILDLLQKGNKNRTTESTAANTHSSRSHAVLQIVIQKKNSMTDAIKVGKLNMIDLAGSERASITSNRGARLLEGANINRSLLSLANCINALAKGQRKRFVPYRDSKLTRLLKDSLGGNCRTVMIANASPADFTYEDTLNTLKYANRAKNIRTKTYENVMTAEKHIDRYEKIIKDLRAQLVQFKSAADSHLQKHAVVAAMNGNHPQLLNPQQLKMLHPKRTEVLRQFAELQRLHEQHGEIQRQISQWFSTRSHSADGTELERKVKDRDSVSKQIEAIYSKLQRFYDETVASPIFQDPKHQHVLRYFEMEYKVHRMQSGYIGMYRHRQTLKSVVDRDAVHVRALQNQLRIRDDLLLKNDVNQFPSDYVDSSRLHEEHTRYHSAINLSTSTLDPRPISLNSHILPLSTNPTPEVTDTDRNVTVLAALPFAGHDRRGAAQHGEPPRGEQRERRSISFTKSGTSNNTRSGTIDRSHSTMTTGTGKKDVKESRYPMKCRVSNVVSSGFNTNKTLYPSFRALRQHKLKQLQMYHDESHREKLDLSRKQRANHQDSSTSNYRSDRIKTVNHSKSSTVNSKYSSSNHSRSMYRKPHYSRNRALPRIPQNRERKSHNPTEKRPKFDRFNINKRNPINVPKRRSYQSLHSNHHPPLHGPHPHHSNAKGSDHKNAINMFSRHKKLARPTGYGHSGHKTSSKTDPGKENNRNNTNKTTKPTFDVSTVSAPQRVLFRPPMTSKLKTLSKQKKRERKLRSVYLQ